jgi:hypothetical protein
MATITNLCETIREVGAPAGLEWAGMVVDWWYDKHYGKIYNSRPPYRFKLKDYQALALRELLLSVGMQHVLDDVIRNGIVGQLDQNLPNKPANSNLIKLLQ